MAARFPRFLTIEEAAQLSRRFGRPDFDVDR
jgi:hypothetical protein